MKEETNTFVEALLIKYQKGLKERALTQSTGPEAKEKPLVSKLDGRTIAFIKALLNKKKKMKDEKKEEKQVSETVGTVSLSLDIYSATIRQVENNQLLIEMHIVNKDNTKLDTTIPIDSGAGGKFIDQNYAKNTGFKLQKLDQPIKVFNIDRMPNKKGTIKHFVDLTLLIRDRKFPT